MQTMLLTCWSDCYVAMSSDAKAGDRAVYYCAATTASTKYEACDAATHVITPPPIGKQSLCLFVRDHISGTARPIFTNFCACYLWPWLGPPLAA